MKNPKIIHLYVLIGTLIFSAMLLAPTVFPGEYPKWWPSQKLKLGLDLRGGSYFVLSVQTDKAVEGQLNSIAQRIKNELSKERIGIVRAKPSDDKTLKVTLLKDRGVDRLSTFVKENFPDLIRGDITKDGDQTVVPFFFGDKRIKEIEKGSVDQAIETIRNRVDAFGLTEPTIQRSGENRILVQLPDLTDLEGVKKTIGSVAQLEFRLVADGSKGAAEDTRTFKSREGGSMTVYDDVLMTGNTISNARVEFSPQTGEVEVTVEFNSVGAQLFSSITTENVKRRLAIVLDGMIQSAPVIREPITGGRAQITGGFTTAEATRLAIVLRSGALPAPLVFEEQRTIGASLGADSIRNGFTAMIVGSLAIVLFMSIYYRKAGQLAVLSLVLNLIWLVAMLAMFGGTLTLPGIAGLALTVGMAVDANVVIFERIREELRKGASSNAAIEAGFDRAHWTILDANMTTLLSGVILYSFGTGPIKGFAVTLSLGIITTLLAALYASKQGFFLMNMKDRDGNLSI